MPIQLHSVKRLSPKIEGFVVISRSNSSSSKLVFYAQSTGTGTVISGRYTSEIIYLIFNKVYVLKWVYIQF